MRGREGEGREGGLERSEEAGWEGLEVFCGCSVLLCDHIEQCKQCCLNICMLSSGGGQSYFVMTLFKALPQEMGTRS